MEGRGGLRSEGINHPVNIIIIKYLPLSHYFLINNQHQFNNNNVNNNNRNNEQTPTTTTIPTITINKTERKKVSFDPIPMSYAELYPSLVIKNLIQPRNPPQIPEPLHWWYKPELCCAFHKGAPG